MFQQLITNTPISISLCKYFQRCIEGWKTLVGFHFTDKKISRGQGGTRQKEQIYLLIEIAWKNRALPQRDFMKTRPCLLI